MAHFQVLLSKVATGGGTGQIPDWVCCYHLNAWIYITAFPDAEGTWIYVPERQAPRRARGTRFSSIAEAMGRSLEAQAGIEPAIEVL